MLDGYLASYASISYVAQTTSLSSSINQQQSDDERPDFIGSDDTDYNLSLGITATATVETFSLLVVQESRDFGSATEEETSGQPEKSALQTVLEGPTDPFDPVDGALSGFFSGVESDINDNSEKGNGNKYGHEVRDNTHGHSKSDIQAAYRFVQLEVSTTTVDFNLVA